ncbi:class I SAM-dependent methyltransferase [Candidatus Bathyarchaeota archaeon]|nr:MAG: class I SAM-dependent methyltransferase [Candidatus Bathyarchaeota archaeon]
MTGWEYEDREYWEKVYALPENYMVEAAVIEGNDGENEFDAKMLNGCVGKVVLDIGCGDGPFTIRMAERAKEVVGVDFSRVAISEARKNLSNSGQKNLRFELANAESLHFPNETFDLVTCRRGPVTDRKRSLREAHRVLKRHGILMEITIGERDKENLTRIFGRGQMIGSERVIDLKERMLREAGFENLQIKEYIATEIFPTIRDLIIRLKDSPIIPDFDPEKDKRYLEEIVKTCKSSKGIETPTHRVTIIAHT